MKNSKVFKVRLWLLVGMIGVILSALPFASPQAAFKAEPMVAAGYGHTVGLKSDGTVVATGDNDYGQSNVSTWKGITQVAAGEFHTVGLTSDGTVVATGENYFGQNDVSTWTDISQISASRRTTVGLTKENYVVAAGDNSFGQCNVSTWTDIIQVAAGGRHTVGLKRNGTVVGAGDNSGNALDFSTWTDIIQVAAFVYEATWRPTESYTLGLRSDGTVAATGLNDHGELSVSDWRGMIQVAVGYSYSVGLSSCGKVVAIGVDGYGRTRVGAWVLFDGLQEAYDEGYAAGQAAAIAALTAQYEDNLPPDGSLHVADDWAPNSKSVVLTIAGHVRDVLSIARDKVGTGVSAAWLRINGSGDIPLVRDGTGEFSAAIPIEVSKDSVITVSLYAADTRTPTPNVGLVDQVTVRPPKTK